MATDFSAQAESARSDAARSVDIEDASLRGSFDELSDYSDEQEESPQERVNSTFASLRLEDHQLRQALGWFSIGLGAAELLAPRAIGRAIGVGDHSAVLRLLGVREIVSGLGLLSERAPGAWAWSRVVGDALDLTLLGAASRLPGADPKRIAIATAGVLGVTALDVYAGQRLSASQTAEAPQIAVTETVTINSTPAALYSFWKNLENLPLFMDHLESVSVTSERTSHWIARAPAGTSVEWDAEIVDDQPQRCIGWRTLPDSQVTHEGMVTFEPALNGRGTTVRIDMLYRPPVGKIGAQIARLFGEEPRVQINDDLRRLKQLLETGEVATTIGQPAGKRSLLGRTTLGRRMQ